MLGPPEYNQLKRLVDGKVDASLVRSWAKLLNQRQLDIETTYSTETSSPTDNAIFFSADLYSQLTGDDGTNGIWPDKVHSVTDSKILLLNGTRRCIFSTDILVIPVLVSTQGSGSQDRWFLVPLRHAQRLIQVVDTLDDGRDQDMVVVNNILSWLECMAEGSHSNCTHSFHDTADLDHRCQFVTIPTDTVLFKSTQPGHMDSGTFTMMQMGQLAKPKLSKIIWSNTLNSHQVYVAYHLIKQQPPGLMYQPSPNRPSGNLVEQTNVVATKSHQQQAPSKRVASKPLTALTPTGQRTGPSIVIQAPIKHPTRTTAEGDPKSQGQPAGDQHGRQHIMLMRSIQQRRSANFIIATEQKMSDLWLQYATAAQMSVGLHL